MRWAGLRPGNPAAWNSCGLPNLWTDRQAARPESGLTGQRISRLAADRQADWQDSGLGFKRDGRPTGC
jgi:hypothetical protein